VHKNCLLKHVIEGKIAGKDGSDGKTGKKTEDDLKETRLYWIALCRELALEEAMDL